MSRNIWDDVSHLDISNKPKKKIDYIKPIKELEKANISKPQLDTNVAENNFIANTNIINKTQNATKTINDSIIDKSKMVYEYNDNLPDRETTIKKWELESDKQPNITPGKLNIQDKKPVVKHVSTSINKKTIENENNDNSIINHSPKIPNNVVLERERIANTVLATIPNENRLREEVNDDLVAISNPSTTWNGKNDTPTNQDLLFNARFQPSEFFASEAIDPSQSFGNMSDIYSYIRYNGIYDKDDIQWFNMYSRYELIEPYRIFENTKEYVFFTRPDLHLFADSSAEQLNTELSNNPYFIHMFNHKKYILQALQSSVASFESPFIPILTMASKSAMDLPSITSTVTESAANIYGTEISYLGSSEESDENHDFSMEFEETKDLYIYDLFKTWDEYERMKAQGFVSPPNLEYIFNKVLHDQISWYKFIVDNDSKTILFYAKGWGVYPKGVPRESFSDMDAMGGKQLSIPMHAEFVHDMDPLIIDDFNTLCQPYINGKKRVPVYDQNAGHVNRDWLACPYIDIVDGGAKFQLSWWR